MQLFSRTAWRASPTIPAGDAPLRANPAKAHAKVQRAARSNGRGYRLGSGEAVARNLLLRLAGGKMLLRRFNWLYDWRTPPPRSAGGSPRARAGTDKG